MRITCPNCSATYDVPDTLLAGPARPVRCARCARQWVPEGAAGTLPAEPPTPAPPLPPPATEPMPTAAILERADAPVTHPSVLAASAPLVDRSARRGMTATAVTGWLVTVLVLGAALAAAYAWRGSIEAAWPPSQRAYAALGLS